MSIAFTPAFSDGFQNGYWRRLLEPPFGAFDEHEFSSAFELYHEHSPTDPPHGHPDVDPGLVGAYSWAFSTAYDRDDKPPPVPKRRELIFKWRNREGGIDRAWYVGDTYADGSVRRG